MLTYIQINAAKPRAKAWNLSDSQNLYLVIQPNGSKLWRFNYRFLGSGPIDLSVAIWFWLRKETGHERP
ncbi:MAG: Arm DNA-binding domain-containing protein, partial [Sphingobium sp.]|nr:Arm DNA-binding domain-containing protein [Sphingobium sp.]